MAETDRESSQSSSSNVKIYLKALPIRQLSDIASVETEVSAGNIVIAKITPLAKKSLEDMEHAIDELCIFVNKIGGEIARLGEERLVVTPPSIHIWKEKESLE